MKGRFALLAVPVLAVTSVAVPGYAADLPPSADLRMAYGTPEIAPDNASVVWRWTLTNRGAAGAEAVVATHRISADQKVVGVSQPCTAAGSAAGPGAAPVAGTGAGGEVVCRFGSIKPGGRRTGWIRTAVAKPGTTVRVSAQVTWREDPSILPEIDDRPAPEAGDSSGSESWGVSDTGTTTEMPPQKG